MVFSNSRIWLTGASSGIGEALAIALMTRGARVALTARRRDLLEQVAARHQPNSHAPLIVAADVSDRQAVHQACRTIEERFGGIDLAVFNAGVGHHVSATALDAADFHRVFGTNFFGVIHGVEAVVPGMLARGAGHLAVVASLAGYRGVPMLSAYGSSKAALIHSLDSMRFELEPRGVRVTVINPGYVRTPLTARNSFWMPALIDATAAAELIVRGLEQDRREIHFPKRFSWILKTMRILPFPIYHRIVGRVVRAVAGSEPRP